MKTFGHATIEDTAWFDLRRPTSWDPLALHDPDYDSATAEAAFCLGDGSTGVGKRGNRSDT